MGGFRHDLPTLVQHACEVLVHCLHAREQPLSVVLPSPISLVRKRLHFHLATASAFFLALFPFRTIARRASLEGTKSLLHCRRTDSEAQADVLKARRRAIYSVGRSPVLAEIDGSKPFKSVTAEPGSVKILSEVIY